MVAADGAEWRDAKMQCCTPELAAPYEAVMESEDVLAHILQWCGLDDLRAISLVSRLWQQASRLTLRQWQDPVWWKQATAYGAQKNDAAVLCEQALAVLQRSMGDYMGMSLPPMSRAFGDSERMRVHSIAVLAAAR